MDASWLQDKNGRVFDVIIELTERNLLALLAKVRGNPPGSACTIQKDIDGAVVSIKAVKNDEHYADRPPGVMHEDTERAMLMEALDRVEERRVDELREAGHGMPQTQAYLERIAEEDRRPPLNYCSEGAYVEDEPCERTCPGFSQCRDLGCQRDLRQGV